MMSTEKVQSQGNISRRNVVLGIAGAAVVLGVGGAVRFAAGATPLLRPPGAQDEQRFIGTCIRCDRCRSACPRDAIQIGGVEDGLINMRTPKMDYRTVHVTTGSERLRAFGDPFEGLKDIGGRGFCDFCNLCSENCPTGALGSFDPQTQWIGEAVIIPELCIAFGKEGGCRKCVDYCAFDAISLDAHQRPIVDSLRCNGCGVCENICPSSTYRTFSGSTKRGVNVEVNEKGRPQ
jgi:ferredoxin-type protein NapG